METQTDGRAEMSDLKLIQYWENLEPETQKAVMVLLRQLAGARELKLPVAPQEKSLQEDQ